MKKLLIILFIITSLNAKSQTLSTDSLSTIIRTLQKQVAFLMLQRSIYFDSTQMIVSDNPDSLNKKMTIRPWITNSGMLAVSDSIEISKLKSKIAALKVTIPSSIISVQ